MSLAGTVLHETYRLEHLLGEGGMGAVYLASHLRLDRKFAVKVLVPEAAKDEVALGRFQREARVTSGLGHPHIVEVVDFNLTAERRPYIVMELLEGEDLGARLHRTGPLDLAQVASIARQVTSALHAAHDKGIVHRDLKPENVFLCRRGGQDDYVKVLDFGISKVLGSGTLQTERRALVGSPTYMSPEQAEERTSEVDIRTDIYAVGVLLFEMLAGAPPFEAESIPALLYKIVHQDPPALGALRPEVPASIEAVISCAMRKDSDARWASMHELWRALAAALESEGLAYVERTRVSHTAWPGEPDLAVEEPPTIPRLAAPGAAELTQPADAPPASAPLSAARTEPDLGPAPEIAVADRHTTLTTSAGELQRPGARRGTLVLALGATVAALAALAAVLVLGRTGPTPDVAVTPDAPAPSAAAADPALRPAVADLGPPTPASTTAIDSRPPVPDARAAATPRVQPRLATLQIGARIAGDPTWAEVYLDGKWVGRTPLRKTGLAPGRYTLELRRQGYRSTKRILLAPGKTTTTTLDLDR